MSGCKINCDKYMKYNGTMRGIFLGNGTVQIFWDLFENGTKAKQYYARTLCTYIPKLK